jgi:hypothetical protein
MDVPFSITVESFLGRGQSLRACFATLVPDILVVVASFDFAQLLLERNGGFHSIPELIALGGSGNHNDVLC